MVSWLVSKNLSDIDVIKTLLDSGSSGNSGDSQKQPLEMFYKTIFKRICERLLFVTIFHLNLWSGKSFKLLPNSAVFVRVFKFIFTTVFPAVSPTKF